MGQVVRLCLPVLALASVALASCGGRDERPTVEPPRAIDELYARIASALTRPDEILYSRTTATILEDGEERPDHVTEYWIDGTQRRARTQYTLDPSVDSYDRARSTTEIYADGFVYQPDDEDEALRHEYDKRCPGSDDFLIALLLECAMDYGYSLGPPMLAGDRKYEGDEALAIVQETEETYDGFVVTAFIDPSTFLPIAKTAEIIGESGVTTRYTTEYRHDFVDPDSLEASFFDPRTIGYGPPPSLEQTLDVQGRDVPVYWVGEEYVTDSGDEYVLARLPQPLFGERTVLVYETPGGSWAFEILVFSPDSWDAFLRSDMGVRLMNRECVPQSTLSGGDVQIFTIPWPEFPVSETPQTPEEVCDLVVATEPVLVRWGHLAVVEFDDAVVAVGGVARGAEDPPEREADLALLANVVRDLQRR